MLLCNINYIIILVNMKGKKYGNKKLHLVKDAVEITTLN